MTDKMITENLVTHGNFYCISGKGKPLKPIRSQLKKKTSAKSLVSEKRTVEQETVQAVELRKSDVLQPNCSDALSKIEHHASQRTKEIIKQFNVPDKRRSLEIPQKVHALPKKTPQMLLEPDTKPQDSVISQSKPIFRAPKKNAFGAKHATKTEEKKTNNLTQLSQVSNQVQKETSCIALVPNESGASKTPPKQSKSKLSKRSKSGPLSGESKKSGSGSGNQSKSLVNIMKAKFTRAPSIKSFQGKKGDAEPK